MVEKEKAFSEITRYETREKPRDSGITMIVDWGSGISSQRDILEIGGEYVDLAKIAVGISGLLSKKLLRKKIEVYRNYNVKAFPGGQFLEHALNKNMEKEYFEYCNQVNYSMVEVSDNVIHLTREKRKKIIITAKDEFGFEVLGEVGSKKEHTEVATLSKNINASKEAGAWKVLVEATELFDDGIFKKETINQISSAVSKKDLIFELPGKWISGIHSHQIHSMIEFLIDNMGKKVNIGNVSSNDILRVETLRRGLGTEMKL